MSNNRFCMIIPTYNRPNYLRRILNYYNEYGKDYHIHNIIVADSSSGENEKINKETISSLSSLNISHRHYPFDLKRCFYYKIADSLNQVKTEYSVVCADDDFITPHGIEMAIEFLENNPDFTCAHGGYIAFYSKADDKGKQQFYWMPVYPYESITSVDAKTRLLLCFSNYHQTFYAVHRTDFLNMIWKEAVKFTSDARFMELLPSMLDLVYGKMKRLDVLYDARETIVDSAGRTTKNLRDFIKDGTYNERYARFKECLAMHLTKTSQSNIDEAKKVVDEGMTAYMKKHYYSNEDYKPILMHKMKDILDYSKLPGWIDEEIRRLYRRLFVLLKQMRYDDFRSSVDILPYKYYDDFDKIRRHVLLYSKK